MTTITFSEAREKLRKYFGGHDALPLCEAIVDHVEEGRIEEFGFNEVSLLSGPVCDPVQATTAVTILSNLSIIHVGMIFKDEDGSVHELSAAAVSGVLNDRDYLHPVTGQIVQDAAARIYPRFRTNPSLLATSAPAL